MLERERVGALSAPAEPAQHTVREPGAELATRLAALTALAYAELRAEWRRLYRSHPPKKIGRDVLELAVAWKLQERALGGLSPATKRQLAALAQTFETRGDLTKARAIRLKPGARLVREWHGEAHEVLVVEGGFLWRGERRRSLSVIASEITGTHWSGPRFFGLAPNARAAAGRASREGELGDA